MSTNSTGQAMEEKYFGALPPVVSPAEVARRERVLPLTAGAVVERYLETLHEDHVALRFGWPTLDEAFEDGVRKDEVILIAARTGVGKTWVCQQILEQQLIRSDESAALFLTLEMGYVHVAERLIGHALRTSTGDVRVRAKAGTITAEKVLATADHLNRLAVNETMVRLEEIGSCIDAASDLLGRPVNFVAIDYLGLVRKERGGGSRYDMVSDVSRQLKEVAKEKKVVMIIASQLSRGGGGAGDVEPGLDALRDSGVTEEAADRILMMWQVPFTEDGQHQQVCVKIAKNRYGKPSFPLVLEYDDSMVLKEINPYATASPQDDMPF